MALASTTRTVKVNPFLRADWMTDEEKATKPVCALVRFVQVQRGVYDEHGYAHVYVTFLSEKDGKPYGFSESEFELYDFELSCQMSEKPLGSGDNTAYAFEASMRPWRVNLDKAQKLLDTLRKIDRKVKKLNQEWGYASTYGQYVLRYMKAIGVQKVFLESPVRSSFSNEAEYVTYSQSQLATAAEAIDNRIWSKLHNWSENRWNIERF